MRRIFYYAPVATDWLNTRHGQGLHIGPADNKVFSVCRSLRSVGARPVVVSAALNPLPGDKIYQAMRANGVPFVRAFSSLRGGARRLLNSVSFLVFTIAKVRSKDRVLLYNFFPEYVASAAYLKLVGNPAVLDVEDGPRTDESGARGVMVRVSYKLISKLVRKEHVVVSRRLATQLNLSPALPVYGVVEGGKQDTRDVEPFSRSETHVLFGGAILPDTGLDLFLDALRIMSARPVSGPIIFHITGRYDPNAFSEIVEIFSNLDTGLKIILHKDLSYGEYRKLAGSMDIGLCLKLPSQEMGQTTFPSKVIEYASLGMLICSTPVSDVPDIFDPQSALILQGEDPVELADLIISAAEDHSGSAAKATRGSSLAAKRFSSAEVGRNLERFIFD